MEAADIRVPQSAQPVFAQLADMAAALPAPIRKKFKALRARAAREQALSRETSEKRMALLNAIPELKDQIAALTSLSSGRGLAEDTPQVRNARLQLASLQEDLENLNAVYGKGGETGLLVSKLEDFIGRRGHPIFEIVRDAAPILQKGVSLPAAIESRRRRIRELDADLKSVKSAPWPSRLTKRRAHEQIVELSKRGRPDVFALVERFETIGWPMIPTASDDPPAAARVDAAALIAWALGPALIAAIDREIDELSDDQKALTKEQRKERQDQILADRLATEREEESLIERAETEGLPVSRRSDADPRAVLGIR